MRRTPSRPRRGLLRGVAALAALTLASGLITSPSSAVPVDVSAPVVSGSIDLNGNISDLAGVVFQGTIDDETGDISGTLLFPPSDPIVTEPSPGLVAELTLRITQANPGTGSVDLDTGDATFTANVLLELLTLSINGAPVAAFTPCNYNVPLALTGSLDFDTNLLTLAQTGFAITAAGGNACGGLSGAIDPLLATSNNSVEAVIDLSQEVEPPPPTPDPDPVVPADPTPAPTAPPATPVAAAPQFTG